MITWTVDLRVRPGRRDAWIELARELTASSHELDEGCVVYLCTADPDDPQAFLWYEQWDGRAALDAHVARLHGLLGGPARPPATMPPRLDDLLEGRVVTAWNELQRTPPAPADRAGAGVTVVTDARVGPADATARLWALTDLAHAQPGCVTYVWHAGADDAARLLLFEQWQDEAAYLAWIERADPPGALGSVVGLVRERRVPVVA